MPFLQEKPPPWILGESLEKYFDFNTNNNPESKTYTSHQKASYDFIFITEHISYQELEESVQ